MENERDNRLITHGNKTHFLHRQRYTVAFLGFLLGVVINSQRVNISIAIVAMVNSATANDSSSALNISSECPIGYHNYTDSLPSTGEFSWSPELQGYIISAGFFANFISQWPGAILPQKFGVKKVLAASYLISSVCNLLSPVGARCSPYLLLVLSFIRGLAQGIAPPATGVMMAKWFPRSERGYLASICFSGMPAGVFLTGILSGLMTDLGGWPLIFYVFGLFGVFVSILFLIFFYDEPAKDPRISKEELRHIQELQKEEKFLCRVQSPTPWIAMFKSLPTYALVVALFGIQWMNFYLVSVHTLYLGTVLHLPIRQNGFLTGGPFAISMVVTLSASFMSFWINRHTKLKIDTIRKGFNSVSCIGFSAGLLGVYFSKCDILLNNLFLYFTTGMTSFSFAGALITAMDMSPTFCGPLLGFSNTMGSLSGFFIPLMTGKLTNEGQNLTQWGKIFLISTGVSLGCGLFFLCFGSSEVQPWDPAFSKNKQKSITEQEMEETEPSSK